MSLKSQVISGLKWSALSKLLAQLFSWVSTFLVIRILSPEDYGLMAIVSVFFVFITIFTVNGFVTSLVRTQNLQKEVCNQLFTLSLALYICISLIISYFAPNIASFYNNQEIENVIYAMAFITPLNSFCIIPNAYLNIEMNFKAKAICESIAAFISAFVALYFAYAGAGYWALFYSLATELVIRTLLLNYVNQHKYSLDKRFNALKTILSFSYKIQLNELIWFSYNKLDTLIVGKFLGIQQLGIYNVGVEIASLPMTKASAILNQVGFSAFSKVNDDKSAGHYYLERAIKLVSLFIFPIFLGISAVSYELVEVFLGQKWIESAAIIAVFAFLFPLRMINAIIYNFVISINQPGFAIKNTLLICVLVICSILIGVQFGLLATALSWLVGFCLAFLIILVRANMLLKISYKILFSWLRPMCISLFMWLLIFVFDHYFSETLETIETLAAKISIGALVIIILYSLFYTSEITSLISRKQLNKSPTE